MSRIYLENVMATNKGGTAGTQDSVGTITLKDNTRRLFGFVCGVASRVSIAAEAVAPIVNFIADGIGATNNKKPLWAIGANPATNNNPVAPGLQFLPWYWDQSQSGITLEDLKIEAKLTSANPDPTNGFDASISALFEAGDEGDPIPTDYWKTFRQLRGFYGENWFDESSKADSADVTTAVALPAITVIGPVGQLTSATVLASFDAEEAAKPYTGHVELTMTDWGGDFTPMKLPLPPINASLGTPVGRGILQVAQDIPLWLDKKAKDRDIIPKSNAQVAIQTGHPALSVALNGIRGRVVA